ncbi:membrane hypothetical protein [metagenome]|uniref:Uncharacterized protein n=1 Tax=metagenome TaxID=256318 RepID=A0A2P2BXU8_9ZZZZ
MTGVPLSHRQLLVTSLTIFLTTALTVGGAYADWLGSWGETSAALEVSTVLTYPAMAGISAWFTSAARRQRHQWMLDSAARPQYQLHLRLAALQASLASAGLLTAAVLAVAATATQATFGSFPIVDLFTIVAGFFAAAGFGTLVATLLPPVLSPISALALVYAVEAYADTSRPSLRPLAGLLVADQGERTYLRAATWMLGLRGVWLLALGLVLVAIAARAGSKAFVPFTVACLAAVPLLLVGDAGMTVDPSATKPVCHHPRPTVTVCLSAAQDHAYSSVWSALEPELDLLHGLADHWHLAEGEVAHQLTSSYRDGTVTVPFQVVNGFNGNAHVPDRKDTQSVFSDRVLQNTCESSGPYTGRQPLANPEDIIQAWLLRELDIPVDDDAPQAPHLSPRSLDYTTVEPFRRRWEAKSAGERRLWFRAHAQEVIQCRLRHVDVMTP